MIRLRILEYTPYKKINGDITRYVNDNVEDIIQVIIDMLETSDIFTLDGFLPREYIYNQSIEIIYELHELVSSNHIREFVKPKYEFLLYNILEWWKEICNDSPGLDLLKPPSEELIDAILSEESFIGEEGENLVYEAIIDYHQYFNFLFDDHDFERGTLEFFISTYLRGSNSKEFLSMGINLDDYVDIMPTDLKELYLEEKVKNETVVKLIESNNNEVDFIHELQHVVEDLETRIVEIASRSEVEISNDIYSNLKRIMMYKFNFSCSREMTIGRAKKKLGETDLYIYKNTPDDYQHIAIIENKVIEKFEDQYKQLLGYLNQNFLFGVTLSINKNNTRYKAIKMVEDKLVELQAEMSMFKIVDIKKPFQNFSNIISSTHKIPEEPNRSMTIYHVILNLHDTERELIAKEARRK